MLPRRQNKIFKSINYLPHSVYGIQFMQNSLACLSWYGFVLNLWKNILSTYAHNRKIILCTKPKQTHSASFLSPAKAITGFSFNLITTLRTFVFSIFAFRHPDVAFRTQSRANQLLHVIWHHTPSFFLKNVHILFMKIKTSHLYKHSQIAMFKGRKVFRGATLIVWTKKDGQNPSAYPI